MGRGGGGVTMGVVCTQCDAGIWWEGTQSVSGLYLSNRRRERR